MYSSRERVLAAASKKSPDRLPAYCGPIDDLEYWLSGFKASSEMELRKAWGLDCQMMPYPDSDSLFSMKSGKTIWGCEDNWDAGYSSTKHFPLAAAEKISDIESHPWPTIEQVDFDKISLQIAELDGDCVKIGAIGFPRTAVFCTLCDLFGMDVAMVNMHLEPHLIEASLERIESFLYPVFEKILKNDAKNIDYLYFGDDFATQRGMMISPEMWRKYLKPIYIKILGLIKSYDVGVWFHCCGSFEPVMGDLVDGGMDVWETVQAHLVDNDPAELKKKYGGHITFFGAINCQQTLPFGTPEEVRKEVRDRFKVLGKNGGYIVGPDHSLQKNIPCANIEALFDEAQKCRY